jgi:hypothetical protein
VDCPAAAARSGLGVRVLGQKPPRTGLQRAEHRLVIGIGGEHDDLGPRILGPHPPGRLDTVTPGHPQIHQQYIRIVFTDQPQRIEPVRGDTGHLDAGQQAQQRGQALPHHGLVIGQHDAQRVVRRHAGTTSRTRHPSSVGPVHSSPPTSSARSRIPVRP